ncbi:MAG: histidinol-phosphate transaminase [Chloroflexi bacterium]|nr:histidinol-phosphate transaminase [Chloroflexota bacterium]
MNAENLIAKHFREMQPYTPIVPFDVLSQRLGIPADKLVKLDANENLYGPSPRALQAMAASNELHIYPDPDQTALRQAIASYIDVPAEQILCGAGGDEIIDLIGRVFVQPGEAIIDLPPTFGMYKWLADILGARYVSVPRRADFSIDIDAVLEAAARTPDAKLLFVANPNNPDGSLTSQEKLRRLLDLPMIIVIDEAYIDFSSHPSAVKLVAEHDNVIVLRTFSKLAGLAGMRVGYGVFSPSVIRHLWKVKQPYTPNVAGGVAAIASLADREWLATGVRNIVAERQRMSAALARMGWLTPFPSETNFVLFHIDEHAPWRSQPELPLGKELKLKLEKHGVLVRFFDKPGLRDCIRISVGKPEHTDALIHALENL